MDTVHGCKCSMNVFLTQLILLVQLFDTLNSCMLKKYSVLAKKFYLFTE